MNTQFKTVTVLTGSLAGLAFTVEDRTPVVKGLVKVKYAAPHNGPRCVVTHRAVSGKFEVARKAEDVRLAFGKLLPANILCDAKKGYSDRKSGLALSWDRQLGRFVQCNKKPAYKIKSAGSKK